MLHRKIETTIINWLKNGKKALLIDGARQVGKTYIIRKVLKDEHCDYIEFNLLETPEIIGLLASCETVDDLITNLSLFSKKPFIITYYGHDQAIPIDIPLYTVTTRDRFALIQYNENQEVTHRMLTSKELAYAMSFPEDYIFCGSDSDAKKQIGNAVPPVLAEALYRSVLAL